MITTIPFSGFYCTLHDSALDDAIEQMFSTDGCVVNNGLVDRAQFECEWGDVRQAYAKEYAEQFSREFNIDLTFESMESPKYYNFTTDRIFCNISESELNRVFDETPEDVLERVAADMFTSRDGFSSFYPNDPCEWGTIDRWDHNQIGCLIAAYVESQNPDFDQYAEYALMEDAQCNGKVWNWIDENTPNMGRLHKVFSYLEQRAERA
jgi:hypothetical protein